eukprot:CAMPEP_0181218972 /NCGR_PEP_ID=MMETSP1096-20121128/27996_1 /TAXON_ID=156174 ORGANISM="Chrysochromulina ericina, Strain CCMP281" /NCGR_SAMPLE_ID=MMETSP1096 /ASSEMBLY_ACC=CAM_ASM_000453 /LENGTH=54 /DNA_ID=CAMNT_0023311259 /DNA_START=504 /DNA_END=664 /DNA_ORIENTATION=+
MPRADPPPKDGFATLVEVGAHQVVVKAVVGSGVVVGGRVTVEAKEVVVEVEVED